MGTKSVRMEKEDEKVLARIRKRTGWTTSDAFKRGLRALDRNLANGKGKAKTQTAWEIYSSFDLGPGGYAAGPASESSRVARDIIRSKHKRER